VTCEVTCRLRGPRAPHACLAVADGAGMESGGGTRGGRARKGPGTHRNKFPIPASRTLSGDRWAKHSRHRQTDRETDRQAERDRHGQVDRIDINYSGRQQRRAGRRGNCKSEP